MQVKTWVVVLGLVLLTSGATAGPALMQRLVGNTFVTAELGIRVRKPVLSWMGSPVTQVFTAANENGASFMVAANIPEGAAVEFFVPLVNLGNKNIMAELVMGQTDPPEPRPLNVGIDGSGKVSEVIQIGPQEWRLIIPTKAGAEPSMPPDGIRLRLGTSQGFPLGMVKYQGWIKILEYTQRAESLAAIANPVADAFLRGQCMIQGSAFGGAFSRYTLELVNDLGQVFAISSSDTAVPFGPLGVLDTTAYPDGKYTLRLRVFEGQQAKAESTVPIIIDNTPPTAVIDSPVEDSHITGQVPVTGTADDANLRGYTLVFTPASGGPGGQIATRSSPVQQGSLGSWNTRLLPSGEYVLRLFAEDKAGNVTPATSAVVVDHGMPTVSLTAPVSPHVKGLFPITGSVAGSELGGWSLDFWPVSAPNNIKVMAVGSTPIQGTIIQWNTATTPDGEYVLRLKGASRMGTEASTQMSLTVDNTLPSLAIVAPAAGAGAYGNLTVKGTVTDANLESWELALEQPVGTVLQLVQQGTQGVNNATLGVVDTTAFANGDYTLRLTATDKAGNRKVVTQPFTINNAGANGLVATLTAPLTDSWVRGSVLVKGSAAGAVFQSYSLAAAPATSGQYVPVQPDKATAVSNNTLGIWDTRQVPDGNHILRLRVSGGGNSLDHTVNVKVDNTLPVARIISPANGENVSGGGSIVGDAQDANLAEWVLQLTPASGSGTWTTLSRGVGAVNGGVLCNLNTGSLAKGRYRLRLVATDLAGNEASHEITINVRR